MRQIVNAGTSLGKLKASFWVPVLSSVLIVTAFIAIAICTSEIDDKTISLGDSFSLAVGQSALIDGEDLGIKFVDIVADSRCPLEVLCIWQGEVACLVEITHSGTGHQKVLTHPGLTNEMSKAQFGAYQFTFSVEPYPEAGKEIKESEYRLNLLVTKTLLLLTSLARTSATIPRPDEYILTISSTAGGSVPIPGEGTFTYDKGALVDLVAEAEENYRFVNWTGDVDTIANVNAAQTTIAVEDYYDITANFKLAEDLYSLTISGSYGGSVTTPGEGTFYYDRGKEVYLVAESKEFYRFVSWTGDVESIHNRGASITHITMYGDYSIIATFRSSTCFIATVAYGTPMAEEVQILRQFRDEYLLTNPVGRVLVGLYYRVSPTIAEFITEHPGLKPIVRAGLIPAVAMSTVVINTTVVEKVAIVSLLVLVSMAVAIWVTRRRGKDTEYT